MCHNVERRKILSRLALGIPLLAGCLSDDPPPSGVSSIEIQNQSGSEINTTLLVEKDENAVFEEQQILDERHSIENEQWMGEQANYETTVSVSEGTTETVGTAELSERFELTSDDCFAIIFLIRDEENIDVSVGENPC